jgi:hypothetical protein
MYSLWRECMESRERKGRVSGQCFVVGAVLLMTSVFCIANVPSSGSQTAKGSEQRQEDPERLLQQGQARAAIEEYRRAIARAPRDAKNYYGLVR